MNWRNKWVFWGVMTAILALCAVPSVVLLGSLRAYYRFLTGFEPDTLRPTHPISAFRHDRRKDLETPLEFIEFRFSAPRAKRVALIGDFTRWTGEGLSLTKEGTSWEVLLPLPPGRYHYAFLVDGAEVLDPKAPSEQYGERKSSLRVVR